ncbi:hypothetical protein LPJ75_000541 [Coemansia sp. RSA 2598]|nr:hypothetical protein LPJ75_000541 [Coemansia sp. RSA 2598]
MSSHTQLVNSITVYTHQLSLEPGQLVLNLTVHFSRIVELCPIVVSKHDSVKDAKEAFIDKYKVMAKVDIYNNRFQNAIWSDDVSIQCILDVESKDESSFHIFLKESDTINYEYKEELLKMASKAAQESENKARFKEMRHGIQLLNKKNINRMAKSANITPTSQTESASKLDANVPVSSTASIFPPLTPLQSEFNLSATSSASSASVISPPLAPIAAEFPFIHPDIISNNPHLAASLSAPLSAPQLQPNVNQPPCGWALPGFYGKH